MHYHGGKSRLAKRFCSFLTESLMDTRGKFCEPFVGAFNIMPVISRHVKHASCSDIHAGLICLLNAVQDGWVGPEDIPEAEYFRIKKLNDFTDPLTSFASFGTSFGGKEWGAYARYFGQNFARSARSGLGKKVGYMDDVIFHCCAFEDVYETGSTVYCDPPYRGTGQYRANLGEAFDFDKFDAWCLETAQHGNRVFISELSPALPWKKVWTGTRKMMMNKAQGKFKKRYDVTEYLYEVVV